MCKRAPHHQHVSRSQTRFQLFTFHNKDRHRSNVDGSPGEVMFFDLIVTATQFYILPLNQSKRAKWSVYWSPYISTLDFVFKCVFIQGFFLGPRDGGGCGEGGGGGG